MKVRLNKYISDSGLTSRRKAEELILQGRVSVNGRIINSLSCRIDIENDSVLVDGEPVKPEKHVYFLLNKPAGTITSTKDEKKRKTVTELIKTEKKIYPVGRLDFNTTGVLILTNDGNFTNLLLHPANRVPREYKVLLDKALSPEDEKKLLNGVIISGRKGRLEKIKYPSPKNRKLIVAEAKEGRNHFIKNIFSALGYNVKTLHRISFAGLRTDLGAGRYRKLNQSEVDKIIEKYS
ncbi:MAG: pseudouridine synthase [Ignavibacteriaceae bacterium]